MSAVLNSNVASLWASKNLQGAQSKMADSVERLSSGLRINRAKDDAAGLGIANSLTQQINGANQGVRNLNDGISMVQIAEGAIAAAQEMAQRILTLATQGANGTMGTTDRSAIQSEMQQLLTAINSIGTRTKFSGNSLLNVDPRLTAVASQFNLQVSNQTSDVISLGSNAFLNIGGTIARVAATGGSDTTATGATSTMALTAVADPSVVSGTSVYKVSNATPGVYTAVGTVDSVSADRLTVTLKAAVTGTLAGAVAVGWLRSDNLNPDTIVFGGGQTTQVLSATANDKSLAASVRDATDTSSFQMVQRAVTGYITSLSTQRSLLGAYQNQIEFTVSNTTELASNLTAARSNVQDTDYASETATLTKGQILQQAATAMLAQANQMPNVILSLLK
jgi:flagellin